MNFIVMNNDLQGPLYNQITGQLIRKVGWPNCVVKWQLFIDMFQGMPVRA